MPRAVKTKPNVPAKVGGGMKRSKKLYAMPEKIPEGTVISDLLKKQWKVGPSIGIGGFGEIYSACRVGEKSYEYVVKCEPHGNGPLFVEMHFYMRNAKLEDIERFKRDRGIKSLGMPYMLGNGSTEIKGQKHRFIVMPRYGSDVAKHILANGGRLPEATVYRLALQMIDVYEFIHECGYVHADLKAANILLGYGRGGGAQAYLVDYGLASHYTTKEFKPDPKKMHNGTIEYTSRDAHLGVPTMRADLEILGYNLIEWMGGQLPWVKEKLLATPAKVQKSKEDFMQDVGAQLKKITPNGCVSAAIIDFMKYVAKMQYNETPDYEKCRKIFANALKVLRVNNAGDLEFKMAHVPANNNNNHHPQIKQEKTRKPVVVTHDVDGDSSMETLNASDDYGDVDDDDDDDVIFERKSPIKPAPKPALKTYVTNRRDVIKKEPSPRGKVVKRSPLKRSPPITARRAPANVSPAVRKHSPSKVTKSKGISPKTKPKESAQKQTTTSPSYHRRRNIEMEDVANSSSSSHHTPTTTRKANINIRPMISATTTSNSPRGSGGSSLRHGKTVINDQLTPNLQRGGNTYEFNVELDVSMDANVIVNVKRKKKAPQPSTTTTATTTSTQASRSEKDSEDQPRTRVKLRKVASDENGNDFGGASSSGSSPAVAIKKTKRIVVNARK